ncbi:DUF4238 domain-containing protein [Denitrobaculum tricleocarpae]|uniref:DUF4238 domain-containing protein n=1 Tax=Denitrobaculum tricleocarpae TaxID=2591009 RepID=A0A545STQ6_9PROT|nr:DUF4238 domain-containing protein [Denitrobaculum tricleocarpae]TQV68337.1 DUF4238 domain-containing protein [Denitrobaculum tricleocarpae]
MTRTKKQHFVPRFYLSNFTNDEGKLWTHDSLKNTLRQTTPDKTAYEKNFYSPVNEDGSRSDFIEDSLSKIEGVTSKIIPDLLSLKALDQETKSDFAIFLATMFSRSPAQLRQIAAFYGEVADWVGTQSIETENRRKEEEGQLTEQDIKFQEFIRNKENYEMSVDRRVGLMAFKQSENLAAIMVKMNWTFEVSDTQELLTSDNPVFWIDAGPDPVSNTYGFGLKHPQAVIPFPLSSSVILRLDWFGSDDWTKHRLSKRKAKLANQYQAKHKDRHLYFKNRSEGFRKLGMKYSEPIQQLQSGRKSPNISVVRKLTS